MDLSVHTSMIDVHRIEDDSEWNDYVERAAGGSVFHRLEFLRAIAAETGTTLDLLVGRNGDHPIGIVPIFTTRMGPFQLACSPPPDAGIPHLGPATMLDPNIKFRKAAVRTKEFLEACVEWIDARHDPHYVRIVTNPAFEEVRPFRWLGFDLTPRFTYELDLTRDEDELLRAFSRDARTSIQEGYESACAVTDGGEQVLTGDGTDASHAAGEHGGNDAAGEHGGNDASTPMYTIEEGGLEAVEYLGTRLEQRFAEQGESFPLSKEFLQRVYKQLPPETVQAYSFRVDGQPVSGRLSLVDDGRLTFWQGVPRPTADVDVSVNDLLNWHSIRSARENDCTVAELSGANVERLWDYKAKFNPRLASYYIVERTSPTVRPALKAYKWWKT